MLENVGRIFVDRTYVVRTKVARTKVTAPSCQTDLLEEHVVRPGTVFTFHLVSYL